MLTFRQLDDSPISILEIMTNAEIAIIKEMAKSISQLGYVNSATSWQMARLEELGKQRAFIIKELDKALKQSEEQLIYLFDEAATRTLNSDNKIYKEAGLKPTSLLENRYLQMIVILGVLRSQDELKIVIRKSVDTTMGNFEKVLDNSYAAMFFKGQSYEQIIRKAMSDISANGLPYDIYTNGRTDRLYSAVRRLVLTGIGQTAANLQIEQMQEMGTQLVGTTAHAGARPSHSLWQGKIFQMTGDSHYPNFYENTGFGTGAGLCGWNCRHSFYPYFEGVSDRAYSYKKLLDYNNRTVIYNGKTLSLYDATQHQRYIERNIRQWKYKRAAIEGANLSGNKPAIKIRQWQAIQRDFINQTGLKRDYFREKVA